MDFDDTSVEAAFRKEASQWLAANAQQPAEGDENVLDSVSLAKRWQASKYEAGYGALTWPVEWGGAGKTAVEAVIYSQEESKYKVPAKVYEIGLGMVLPTIASRGTDEQRQRFLRKGLSGEEIWCQLFSEPGAGSDLAAVDMRSVRDGDDWIINGQKVWTSGAQYCDFGLLLTRSDPSLPKHRGLTAFILDLRSPGVEVQPIEQLSGKADFNQVFLTDVRIADSMRVGEPGDGWKVAVTTLMNERLTVMSSYPIEGAQAVMRMFRALPDAGASLLNLDAVGARLVDANILERGLELLKYRLLTQVSSGQDPGPESSLAKMLRSRHNQELMVFAQESLGPLGSLIGNHSVADLPAMWDSYFQSSALRLGGGTEDIQKNIIAERILGLPQEPSVDRNVPFNELVRS